MPKKDMVNHPPHYLQYPYEVIELTELLPFCVGNAVKYILRAEHKGALEEDLEKAKWYLKRAYKNRFLMNSANYGFEKLADKFICSRYPHNYKWEAIANIFFAVEEGGEGSADMLFKSIGAIECWLDEIREKKSTKG